MKSNINLRQLLGGVASETVFHYNYARSVDQGSVIQTRVEDTRELGRVRAVLSLDCNSTNLGQQDARCGFLFLVLAVCCVGYPIAVHLRLGSSLASERALLCQHLSHTTLS